MKRYNIGCPGCGSPNPDEIHSGKCTEEIDRIEIKEADNGEWVRYEDAQAAVANLNQKLIDHQTGESS